MGPGPILAMRQKTLNKLASASLFNGAGRVPGQEESIGTTAKMNKFIFEPVPILSGVRNAHTLRGKAALSGNGLQQYSLLAVLLRQVRRQSTFSLVLSFL